MLQRIRRGFTLVELLVVIGIIAVLIGILIPVLGKVHQHAIRTKCAATLQGVGHAILAYRDMNHMIWPNGVLMRTDLSKTATLYNSLKVQLDYNPEESWHCAGDETVFQRMGTSYIYINPLSKGVKGIQALRDDASSVMVGADYSGGPLKITNESGQPETVPADPFHSGKINSLYADGHVDTSQ